MTAPPKLPTLPRLPAWQAKAACAGMLAFDRQTESDQKSLCRKCFVQPECLAWALRMEMWEQGRPHGVYGGVGAVERYRMRRKLRAAARAAT